MGKLIDSDVVKSTLLLWEIDKDDRRYLEKVIDDIPSSTNGLDCTIRDLTQENTKLKAEIERLKEMKEHDGCKGCRYEKESIDSNNCIGCVQNSIDKYSKMTNYDMIKNMSVDEMARTLHIISRENGRTINKNINNCNCLTTDFLKWLNSESEVEK